MCTYACILFCLLSFVFTQSPHLSNGTHVFYILCSRMIIFLSISFPFYTLFHKNAIKVLFCLTRLNKCIIHGSLAPLSLFRDVECFQHKIYVYYYPAPPPPQRCFLFIFNLTSGRAQL